MEDALKCPHCQSALKRLRLPEPAGWGLEPQWVCFNDECSYFRDGWEWMWQRYEVKASYRYRIANLETGASSPLPVWSRDAMRDRIVTDSESE